ncbi:MAG: hypothetical protein HQK65_03000 [Desulfamplus sp.]|nr:hypothetical protein [Desulfamplus sp.]
MKRVLIVIGLMIGMLICGNAYAMGVNQKADALFDQLEYLYEDTFYPPAITQEKDSIFTDPYNVGKMYYREYNNLDVAVAVVSDVVVYKIGDQWYYYSTLPEALDVFDVELDEEALTTLSQLFGQWKIKNDNIDISFEVMEDGSIINFTANLPAEGGADKYGTTSYKCGTAEVAVTPTNVEGDIFIDSNDFSFTASAATTHYTTDKNAYIDGVFESPDMAKINWRATKITIGDLRCGQYKSEGVAYIEKKSPQLTIPSPPSSVSATDETFTDKVKISWNASNGAISYEVWRYTSNNSSYASKIGTTSNDSYNDSTAKAGVTYYYWLKAVNASGTSDFSSSDSGYRKIIVPVPSAPTGVSASDGTSTLSIDITWNASSGATSYEVWQSKTNKTSSARKITSTSKTSYTHSNSFDFGGGTIYYYWIKAVNESGTSDFSSSDSGYVRKLW